MFMQNIVEYPQSRPVELFLTNVGSAVAEVSIDLPNVLLSFTTDCATHYSATVGVQSSTRVILCSKLRHSYADGSISPKAVFVNSTSPVRLIGYNSESYSADAFIVTPVNHLGRAHLVSAYTPANIATQFGIVAATDVNIAIFIGPSRVGNTVVDYNGFRYANGNHFRFMLPKGSTFLAYSVTDLSGVAVQADGPIAVFSGNVRTYADYQQRSRDHLVEQLIPSAQLGTQFVFVPTPRGMVNDIVRFIARLPATFVTLVAGNSSTTFTLNNAGDIVQRALTEVTHIIASSPLSVAVIVRSQQGAAVASTDPADPSLYFLQATDQYIPALSITPELFYSITNGPFSISYLLISIPEGALSGLRLDGVAIAGVGWEKPSGPGALPYLAGAVPINPAASHLLTHTDSSMRVSAVIYSASDRESAATTLGFNFARQCVETTQVVFGDGIDNDCDGFVDEEIFNGMDDDFDLLIDEDCKVKPAQAFGNAYAVVFMSNDISDQVAPLAQMELYVAPVGNVNVTVSVTSPQFLLADGITPFVNIAVTAPVNAVTQISINDTMRLGFEGDFGMSRKTQKGIYVYASSDIVLYGINKRTFSTDGFIGLPFSSAGSVYYAVTGYPINSADDKCQIGIVSHQDGALIQVTIRSGVVLTVPPNPSVTGPAQFSLPMDAFEAWEFQSDSDLTGTKIQGMNEKTFSVFTGNVRHRVTLAQGSRDHLVEQMPPASTLGSMFSAIASPRLVNVGDYWKIVASQPNTTVTYWYKGVLNASAPVVTSSVVLVKETDFFVIDPNRSVTIRIVANQPILVTQIVKSSTVPAVDFTDPALILIPPQQQWGNDYLFVTPKSGQSFSNGTQKPYVNYILLVVDASVQAGLNLVNPDGSVTNLGTVSGWTSVPNTSHVGLVWPIHDGQNKITHPNANVTYMGVMFGVQDRESYGQAVGLRLGTMCHTTTMTPGDLIDNDCDGAIDEELIDSLDNDGDGLIDEDCYKVPALNVTYLVVYEENDVEYPRYYPLELYIGNDNAANAYCRIVSNTASRPAYDVTVKITSQAVKEFAFSPSLRVTSSRQSFNSFVIYCNTKVTVFGINKETYSNDGFIAYPVSSLGRTYYTVSYSPQDLLSQFAIVAAQPGQTNVAITVAADVHMVSGTNYTSGQTINVVLNQYNVFQVQSAGDLTASYVQSDQKVAVFSGDIRTRVELSASRDHLVYQMPPTDSWGTIFNLVPSPNRTVGDVYRIISRDSSNAITLCCNGPSSAVTFSLQQGQWKQLDIPSGSYCQLTSTKPSLVARIMKSQNGAASTELSDPCLTLVVPISQYGHHATLITPLYTGGKSGIAADYTHYLTVVVPSGKQNGLLISGNPINFYSSSEFPLTWTAVQCSTYVSGTVIVPGGRYSFHITHTDLTVAFTGHLDGAADRESYCVSLAQVLPDLA